MFKRRKVRPPAVKKLGLVGLLEEKDLSPFLLKFLDDGSIFRIRAVSSATKEAVEKNDAAEIKINFRISKFGLLHLNKDYLLRWKGEFNVCCKHYFQPNSPWFTALSRALEQGRSRKLHQLELAVMGQNLSHLNNRLLQLRVPTRPRLVINYDGAGAELSAAAQQLSALVRTFPAVDMRVYAKDQDLGGLQAAAWLQTLSGAGILLRVLSLR
jgi:hypothetical protein